MYDMASRISASIIPSEKSSLLFTKEGQKHLLYQWPQHLAAMLACSYSLAGGCVAGWSASAIPYLQGNLGVLDVEPISDSEASWIGSIVPLGALIGAFPAGKLAGIFGRKAFLLFVSFPLILGWLILLYFYEYIYMLYLGRLICGMVYGATTVAIPMYNNEIAEDKIRGVMGVYFDITWCIGVLFSYIVGAYTSYYWLTLSSCLLPLGFMFCFVFMPESPVYLLVNQHNAAAENSLRWLRSGTQKNFNVAVELAKIQQMIDEAEIRKSATSDSPIITDFKTLWKRIKTISHSTTCKAVLVGFGLMTFQRLSGVSAVIYYTLDIFRGAGTKFKPQDATIIVGVTSLFASVISAICVDRFGRRFLLLVSGGAMTLSLFILTVYFILKSKGYSDDFLSWLSIITIVCYIAMFGIGYGSIPWFYIDEIMPKESKYWANSAIIVYSFAMTFVVTKSFAPLVMSVGYAAVFGTYSVICVIGMFFVAFYLPETRNKSWMEINNDISLLFCNKNKYYESI